MFQKRNAEQKNQLYCQVLGLNVEGKIKKKLTICRKLDILIKLNDYHIGIVALQ